MKEKKKGVQLIDTWCESNLIVTERTCLILTTTLLIANSQDDIVVDDGWSIPSTVFRQTVKLLEVIQEVV